MQQILSPDWLPIPIYGYGTMLFLAFVGCTWLAIRLGRTQGIAPEVFKDLGVWLFVSGILGARITYIIQYWHTFHSFGQFFAIWDGGLVFYGSIFGAIVGFVIADHFLQKKYPYDRWKLADCIAPCIALGLALGRIGCLLNGCCFGNVACDHCPAIHFPLPSPPRYMMVERGYQTTAGFTLDPRMQRTVEFVEPGSPAEAAGLKAGDVITHVNGVDIVQTEGDKESFGKLHLAFLSNWPRGKNDLALTVVGADGRSRPLPTFVPRTIGLHPTQIYETISMLLMLFFLVSYFPYRPADGSLMVIFMFGYGIHRFLNEMLRTDTTPVAFNMTLSQNISLLVLAAACILAIAVVRHATRRTASPV